MKTCKAVLNTVLLVLVAVTMTVTTAVVETVGNIGAGVSVGANTLTGLIPTLYEALDTVSRELVGLIRAVRTDHSIDRAAVSQTVRSFATPAASASNITPGVTAPNDGDQTISYIDVSITKSRYVPIRWTGEEQRSVSGPNGPGGMVIMRDQFAQAFRTLANEVETDVFNEMRVASSRAVGTPGTAPFGTANDLSDFALSRQILEDNGAPTSDLHYVGGSAAIANLRGKQALLLRVNESGDGGLLLRKGIVGEVDGFQVGNSNAVRAITKGTGTSYTSSAAGFAVGTTSIPIITGSGTVLAGDTVTFAGDSNKYVVVTGVAAPGTIVIAAPGLRQAIPASATAMTIGNSATPNLAFARTSTVLATRMPAVPVDVNGNPIDMAADRVVLTDPLSGLSFEVALYTQYRQLKYEVGLAWGQKVVKQEHIAQNLG